MLGGKIMAGHIEESTMEMSQSVCHTPQHSEWLHMITL